MHLLCIFTSIYDIHLPIYSCLLEKQSKLEIMFGIVIGKYDVNLKLCEIDQIM